MTMVKKKGEYQKTREAGRLGSCKDHTWNKKLHIHTCCKSKQPWYHKIDCPALKGEFLKPQLKSQEKISIDNMKKTGMTSLEVAKVLNMPIEMVNKLWG